MCTDASPRSAATASHASLPALLSRLTETLRSRIEMSIDLERDMDFPPHVSTLFQLLVRNAVAAMPRGGPVEFIGRHRVRSSLWTPSRRIVFALRCVDHGLGMTPLMLHQAFDDSDVRESWGRSIVERLRSARRLAEAHDGRLFVASALGYGARVEVHLPAADDLGETTDLALPPIGKAA